MPVANCRWPWFVVRCSQSGTIFYRLDVKNVEASLKFYREVLGLDAGNDGARESAIRVRIRNQCDRRVILQ